MTVLDDIAEIGDLLQRLRAADVKLRVFGSDEHGYRLGRVLSEAKLRGFENRNSIRLPEDYRRYLATLGNGGAGPYYGLESLQRCRGDLTRTFPFTQDTRSLSEERRKEDLAWEACPGALQFCHQGCGIYAYLVVKGETLGAVWDGRDDFAPTGMSFSRWYRSWAERALRVLENENLVHRIKVGMSTGDVQAAVAGDWGQREVGPAPFFRIPITRLYEAPEIPVQLLLDEHGIVVEVRPWLFI